MGSRESLRSLLSVSTTRDRFHDTIAHTKDVCAVVRTDDDDVLVRSKGTSIVHWQTRPALLKASTVYPEENALRANVSRGQGYLWDGEYHTLPPFGAGVAGANTLRYKQSSLWRYVVRVILKM